MSLRLFSVGELREGAKIVRCGIIQAAERAVDHPLAEEIHAITTDEVKRDGFKARLMP